MTMNLRWLGHASWWLETEQVKILIDPFLNDSPTSPVRAEELDPDYLLVSHGHADHTADVESIARRTGAMVIGVFELVEYYGRKGIENRLGMNIGGQVELPFGSLKMVRAEHSSSFPDGTYAGCPAGFVISIDTRRIYFACDTGLFRDMQLIGADGLDLAVLPIGDLFTMGPAESVQATEWLAPRQVLPAHYNTWPPIEQDPQAWAEQIRSQTGAEPIVLEPGEIHRF